MARKAIFVTGGASGIGRAIARHFIGKGWHAGIADTDLPRLYDAAAQLPAGLVTMHQMDVTDRDTWDGALESFMRVTGRIDVLCNNAGLALAGPLMATPIEEIERVVAVNLMGVIHGAQCGYPFLAQTPGSCLLNTASAAALYGTPNGAVYSATKFAVRGLTESLDAEWAADGIKVRSLMPGFIDTPLLDTRPHGSDGTVRDRVTAQGFEITPPERVAEAAWAAVHGDRLHTLVGRTARKLDFAARWMPGRLRQRIRAG